MNLGYLSCLKSFPIPNFLQEFINDWPVAYLGNFWMYELVSDYFDCHRLCRYWHSIVRSDVEPSNSTMPLYHYLELGLEKPVNNHCVAWYVIGDSKKKKLSSCCWSTQQTSRIVYWWPLRSLPITREVASKRCPFVVWYHTNSKALLSQ